MPLELTPLDVTQLSQAALRVVGPNSPGPAKIMAARGLAPMGPSDLVTVLYQLAHDSDTQIAEAARKTAKSLPENILSGALGEELDPRVLDFFAPKVFSSASLVEKILLNKATHDETFVTLAKVVEGKNLDIVAGNQQRLLRHPAIIEAIYFNPSARMSMVDLLLELAVRNGLTLDGIPQFKHIAAEILGLEKPKEISQEAVENPDELFASVLTDSKKDEPEDKTAKTSDEELIKTGKLSKLSMVAKIRLATLGTHFHRMILIKDTNKAVSLAAISSPAVSEQEAIRYAGQRDLPEEVIRYIANRKEWHKNYTIKVYLVNNPKCPLRVSMGFLSYLRPADLRAVSRSKNIPAALAKAAKHILAERQ